MKPPVLVLYIPVLHQGYISLFQKYNKFLDTLFILGNDLIHEFTFMEKEIRAIEPQTIQKLIQSLEIFKEVSILTRDNLKITENADIITVNDEINRKCVGKYFSKNIVTYESVFLRWDESSVVSFKPVNYEKESTNSFDREMIARATQISDESSDWWRHVGGVVVKNGAIIIESYNHHVPFDQIPYIQGDPRDFIEAGKLSHFSTALHAEQAIVSQAAKKGLSLEGASMYVNVFPCPLCAKLIAYSGIKKCFFATGHASLDGESIMKANGVEIILVK